LSQENPLFREEWIKYSSRDSLATWQLAHHLVAELKLRQWMTPQDGGRKQVTLPGGVKGNMYHFYKIYFRRFGELLTDMEAVGIKVDQRHLPLALSLSLSRASRALPGSLPPRRRWTSGTSRTRRNAPGTTFRRGAPVRLVPC